MSVVINRIKIEKHLSQQKMITETKFLATTITHLAYLGMLTPLRAPDYTISLIFGEVDGNIFFDYRCRAPRNKIANKPKLRSCGTVVLVI